MRLAVVGNGMIVQMVASHLAEWGWEVAGFSATPSSMERTRELCERCGGMSYESYDEMLNQVEADAVYVAVPNSLHCDFARRALEAGFDVICEKPLCTNAREARALAECARARGRMLLEAAMTPYLPSYRRLRELLPRVGSVKVVSANFSQYSSRYDAFRAGTVLSAFDPAKAGGALMDLGLYNTQWIVGLFGRPEEVSYLANVERGIDTSGVMLLDYGSFKAVSVAAKDCAAPSSCIVQGTEGYLIQQGPANLCGPVTLHLNDGTEETFDEGQDLPWEGEFRYFAEVLGSGDSAAAEARLEHSLLVAEVMTKARLSAGVRFPADEG